MATDCIDSGAERVYYCGQLVGFTSPRNTLEIQIGAAFSMNHKKCFDSISRLLLLFAVVSAFAVSASAEWKEKVLYSFQGLPDGAYPAGAVVFDQAGNLYGATTYGGANDCPGITQCGIVFQLQAPAQKGGTWNEHVLYVFKGVNSNDGDAPVGGVIFDQAGNLYGTTAYGGSGSCELFGGRTGCGTIYELVPPKQKNGAWIEKVIYNFQSGKDGYFPWGDLTFDSAGNLYGSTQYGGGKGTTCDAFYQFCGTVFELSPPRTKGGKWTEKVLHSFAGGSDGANPNGGLVLDSKGAIYGTTFYGGSTNCKTDAGVGCGTAFELKPPTQRGGPWTEKLLHTLVNYQKDGGGPNGGLVFDAKGSLYGTTIGGGSTGNGVVFRFAKSGGQWTETIVRTLQGLDGWSSMTGVIFDSVGNLYGTASGGGSTGGGTVFKLNPQGGRGGRWGFGLLHTFTGPPDGEFPTSRLVFDQAGNLYGTTQIGGSGQACRGGCGVVFETKP
jgi:uncharacterized repeat protein (TIGR03803 family)